jgi:hypothetical protein
MNKKSEFEKERRQFDKDFIHTINTDELQAKREKTKADVREKALLAVKDLRAVK